MKRLKRALSILAIAVALFLGGSLLVGIYMSPTITSTAQPRSLGDLEQLRTGLIMYRAYTGDLPTTEQGLQALVQKPTLEPLPRRWRPQAEQSMLDDPWGHRYVYRRAANEFSGKFELFSLGPDGVESADDIRNDSTK